MPALCSRCVMDTSDPDITFDAEGVCHHCRRYDALVATRVFDGALGKARLDELVAEIGAAGRGKAYDCVIGVSGGVDSTFVALTVKKLGLRPLAVHLDNGWDSEIAVTNIARALTTLGIDLHTHVIRWEEFRDLQVAFLRASTPDSEIPSDHAIGALLYQTAARHGVRHIITGHNFRTESHHPAAWSQGYLDWRYIRAIHSRFGSGRLSTFPHLSLFDYWRHIRKRKLVQILNYVEFVKSDAVAALTAELGWRSYGSKHHESIYTRFFQGYILPRKFGFDKRRSHLSSLICSGEMTREEALSSLGQEPYPLEQQLADKAYVLKKLELTEAAFEAIMTAPPRSYWDFPSYGHLYRSRWFGILRKMVSAVAPKPMPGY